MERPARQAGRTHKKAGRVAILVLSATTAFSSVFVSLPVSNAHAAVSTVQAASQPFASQVLQAQATAQSQLQFVREDIVTSGATMRTYKWYPPASQTQRSVDLRVLVIDLHNPYIEINVMNGRNGKLNSRQSVLGMARETDAVAGINASFFHMDTALGNPLGGQIVSQELTVSPLFLKGWYSFGVTTDREPVIGEFQFNGRVYTENGDSYVLTGINKPLMWDENNVQSHTDSIFLYTSVWGEHERAARSYNKPTEILVIDDTVVEMTIDESLPHSIPEDGYVLRGEGAGAEFLQRNVSVGDKIATEYELIDRHTGDNLDPNRFQMMIGGHTLLVDNGQATSFTANVNNISGHSMAARTAVGYSADGRYVYLLTADRTATSRGMTLAELQQAMIQLGIWKGVNLDGGGSTTMVARPLGETSAYLANQTSESSMRQVVNGIGVYTNAPQGAVAGLSMDTMPFLFVGERAELPVKGYDEHYNPIAKVDLTEPGFEFNVTDGYGRFDNGYFIPDRKGQATITVTKGSMKASTEVEIIDRNDIASLSIVTDSAPIRSGSMLELKVTSQLKDGRSREVPIDAVNWRIEGFQGSVEDGVLTVDEVDEYATARLVATYDGLSTSILLPTYVRNIWANFDTIMPPISVDRSSSRVFVDYEVTNEIDGEEAPSNVLVWEYDFSQIAQYTSNPLPTLAFEFNGSDGVEVTGSPNELLVDVYGDGKSSKIWLEATDTNGQLHSIPIGKIDWTGWRTVNVDMNALEIEYPLTIMRLVQESPVNPLPNVDRAFVSEEDLLAMLDPTVVQGTIAVDNLYFQSVNYPEQPENKTIEMQVDNPVMSVNGQTVVIDQAPVVVGGSTMVPIRFIIEAMDGEVSWDPDTNKVTLIRGSQYVEMWLNERDMNFNGRKITAPVPPTALNSRTLVPVRVLSEQLGWNVYWDNDTQSVRLIGRT